jgi:putative ABC transport system permease protein
MGRSPNPLWRKSPFLLTRYPLLLLSLGIGALLLALAASVFPLFISARTSNLVMAAISNPLVTRAGAGIEYRIENLPLSKPRRLPSPDLIGERFRESMAKEPLLGPPIAGVLGPAVSISAPGHGPFSAPGRLFSGDGAFGQVRRLQGRGGGPGIWLSDLTASELGVKPGDRIAISFDGMRPATVTVAAVYRALYRAPRTSYWYWWDSDIYPRCQGCNPPPPFVLSGPDQFARLSLRTGSPTATLSWHAPVAPGRILTLEDAEALERFKNRFGSEITDAANPLSHVFPCCHEPLFAGQMTTSLSSYIPNVIADAERRIAALEQPGRLLQIAGIIVALVLLAAAGAFAAAARRVEQQLLFSQGAGPGIIFAKATIESVLPCLLGGATGLGLAFLLVSAVGPGGPVAGVTTHQAVTSAGFAIVGATLLLGIASTVSFTRIGGQRNGRHIRVEMLPWELVFIALAAYSLRRIQTTPVLAGSASQVKPPSPYLLAFPVLSIAGFALVGARAFGLALRWIRERSGRLVSSLYLAIHRLAGAPVPTFLLVSASALCLGVFLQAQTLVRSLETTVDAKAKLFVGSDVQGRVLYETPLPRSFSLPLTRVTQRTNAGTMAGGAPFDLLAVDPSTIASAAYWNPAFSNMSIQQIASALRAPSGRLPVLIAGGGGWSPTALRIDLTTFPVRVVGHASAFPGMPSRNPLVVVDAQALLARFAGSPYPLKVPEATTEFWVKGDTALARSAVQALKYPPYQILTAEEVKDVPEIAAVIDTFLVMNALALVAALLVFAGLLMYLQARQRSQVVSYGLSLRMGMSHAAHRWSLVAELGSILLFAFGIGLLLALAAAGVLVAQLDPLPFIPPRPLFISPDALIAVTFVAVVAASWLGGWVTNRVVGAADLGAVMRVAD